MSRLSAIRDAFTKPEGQYNILVRLLGSNLGVYKYQYLFAFFMMLLTAAATTGSTVLVRSIMNDIFINKKSEMVWVISLSIIGVYVVKGSATYFASTTINRIGNNVIARIQRQMFDAILMQDVAYFSNQSLGNLVTRISVNAQSARAALDMIVVNFGRNLFMLIGLVGSMFYFNPQLSVGALIFMPVAIIGVVNLIRKVRNVTRREVQSIGEIITHVHETVQGIRVVKAFGLEDRLRQSIDVSIRNVEGQANRIASLNARTSPMMESLGGFAVAAVVMFGGDQVINHNGDVGAFFQFIAAVLWAYEPAKDLARLNVELEGALTGVRLMYEILDSAPTIADQPNAVPPSFTQAEIRLEDVTFSYGAAKVLNHLSLHAPAGAVVALVGPSGAGKSTLFGLVERFYDPQSGRVLINGQDVREMKIAGLRRHIALVTQDTFLFDGTIAANIADGRPEASEADIIAAAKDANAYDFIMATPEGFQSRVGEGGGNLSGGQRQRIAIARAILRQAPILLLDEATSALDAQSETEIQEALSRLMVGRTTLVIAHRLATIRNADLIYVMEAGEVKQVGTHDQLLAEGGLYAHLSALQFGREDQKA